MAHCVRKCKLLFFQWHSFMNKGIEKALIKLGIEYEVFFYQFSDWEKDDTFCEKLREKLREDNYFTVLSVNYSPLISEVCEEVGARYVSWIYDSPLHIRNLESMKNTCNEIYFFDRGQQQAYEEMGIKGKHLPLAVDTEIFASAINKSGRYRSDIAMVGQLYKTDYTYFTAPMDGYLKGYLEGIINSQMKIYGGYIIPELVTDELLEKMNRIYKEVATDGFLMGQRELEYLLAQEVTGRERYLALALLSGRYQTAVYAKDEDERLKNVQFRGYVDYYSQMPNVFAESKINLNISLKTIRTGIPLRVLDVLGCGGFLISNYQEEIAEYFKVGEECEVYESLEDLVAKVDFYMRNEEAREKVALAGFERVKRDFTFEDRITKMI